MYKELELPQNVLAALANNTQEVQFYNQEKQKITEAVKQISNYDALIDRRIAESDQIVANFVKQSGYEPEKVKSLSDNKVLIDVPEPIKPELIEGSDDSKKNKKNK
jgi:hypothetical protein